MRICPDCGTEYGGGEEFCRRDGARLTGGGDDPLIGRAIGSYRLTRLLGAGGMGQVYLGLQPHIGSRVAVKLLSPDAAARPDLVDRFFAEAMAVNKIRHENIVNILDVGRLEEGRPYLIMEFLEGRPLSGVIAHFGALPPGTLTQLAGEILGALEAAHRAGVIHRDLKPDNVFVSPQGRARVLDFGIAKLLPSARTGAQVQLTQTGMVLGTPAYMSPEQVVGGEVSAASDLYSLGVILYEAATGRVPFEGSSLYELLHHQVHTPPPPPRQLRGDLPPAIEAVILRALAKAPAARFASAEEMGAALSAAAAGLPPAAWASISLAGEEPALLPTPTPSPMSPMAPMAPMAPVAEAPPRPAPPRRGRAIALTLGAVALLAAAVAVAILANRDGTDGDRVAAAPPVDASAQAPPARADAAATKATRADAAPAGAPSPVPRKKTPPAKQPQKEHGSSGGGVTFIETSKQAEAATGKKPFSVAAGVDTRRFDAVAFLPRARALARRVYPDAVMTHFEVEHVRPDGRADLHLPDGGATYRFRSPSHSARPASMPRGVEVDIWCMVYVEVEGDKVNVHASSDEKCDARRRPRPRCSLAAVWKKARALGAPTGNWVANIDYLWDGWFFDIPGGGSGASGDFTESIPDDC